MASAEKRSEAVTPGPPEAAMDRLAAIEPRPYLPDYLGLSEVLANSYGGGSAEVLWLSGALDNGDAATLAAALQRIGGDAATFLSTQRPATIIAPPVNGIESLTVPITRFGAGAETTLTGYDTEGRQVIEQRVTLEPDQVNEVEIALPAELRNALTRFALDDETSAGAVQLLDGRWQRKTVGLIAGETGDSSQPLLTPLTYVQRALVDGADLIAPYATSTAEAIDILIKRNVSMIVLTDTGNLPPETTEAVSAWVNNGGTLLRFASPRLAASDERLLPMPLRTGERAFGGSLSWQEPQAIGGFSETGPFRGIEVPFDVRVTRQILADPITLDRVAVWAELADGTPLVTAREEGRGRLILFHVTADPRWSNLPLSGAFVEMLIAIGETAIATTGGDTDATTSEGRQVAVTPWKPVTVLDGYGKLGEPGDSATLIAEFEGARPSLETPPGIYDRDGTIRALNAVDRNTELSLLDSTAAGWNGPVVAMTPREEIPVWPWVLAIAVLLGSHRRDRRSGADGAARHAATGGLRNGRRSCSLSHPRCRNIRAGGRAGRGRR